MEITHGRQGEYNEYLEIKLLKPRVTVLAQKNSADDDFWVTYIVWPGKNAPVRKIEYFDRSEDARRAIETMAHTVTQFVNHSR